MSEARINRREMSWRCGKKDVSVKDGEYMRIGEHINIGVIGGKS